MNVHEYERIIADPERVKAGVLGMFYAQSRRPIILAMVGRGRVRRRKAALSPTFVARPGPRRDSLALSEL